jgi:alpha-methylacyl-CoA racemase
MGPLAGKRIIEIAGIGPGPFCGMLFADMGAEVILVEKHPGSATRPVNPSDSKFRIVDRGKRSIALDLKQPAAVDIVMRLVEGADGLIEGFRPGVMERLGLGPAACLKANPGLVFGRVTGWGQDGPLSQAAGHDLNYIALSGALHYAGRSTTPPTSPATLVGDIGGGAMLLAVGMLAAMVNAQATGEGQVVDAAITEGSALATSLIYGLFKDGRWSCARESNLLDGASHWYDCYQCADGKFIAVGSLEPEFYAVLLDKLGLKDDSEFASQYDPRRWPALKKRFTKMFRERTREQWCDLLEGSDACFAPVLDFDEAPMHAHNRERGVFTSVAGVTQPAPAPRFSKTVSEVAAPPPAPGQHAESILRLAGIADEDFGALRAQGVIG